MCSTLPVLRHYLSTRIDLRYMSDTMESLPSAHVSGSGSGGKKRKIAPGAASAVVAAAGAGGGGSPGQAAREDAVRRGAEFLASLSPPEVVSFIEKTVYKLGDVPPGGIITLHSWTKTTGEYGAYPLAVVSFNDVRHAPMALPPRFLENLEDRGLPCLMLYRGTKPSKKGQDMHLLEFIAMKRFFAPA